MKSTNLFLSFGLLALQSRHACAYWRMACGISQTARADPIVNPGGPSGHAHKFAGGNNVNQYSTFDSLQSSTCSSCEVQADKSAYWTPQLYYAHSNGTFEEVPNYGMTVYYVGRGGNSSSTVPFPPGFRMISGSSKLRSYDSQNLTYMNTRPVADRVSFRCINEANDIPEQHYLHRTDCVNGMRAQVNFQSCWDGVNLYLPGNAHVNYLSGIDYGICPPSHPVSIPGLFSILYFTNLVDQSTGGRFVFANGDTTGFGFHGDFMNGWNMDTQTRAVQDCLYIDTGGVVTNCPDLAATYDANFARTCPQQPPILDEPVHGLLTALPGCNPVTSGPALVPQVVCPLNSHQPLSQSANTSTQTSTTSIASSTNPSTSLTTSSSIAKTLNSTAEVISSPTNSVFLTTNVSLSEGSVSTSASTTTTELVQDNNLGILSADNNTGSSTNPSLTSSPSSSILANLTFSAGAFYPNSTIFTTQSSSVGIGGSPSVSPTVLPAAVQNGTVVTITLTEMITLTVTVDPGAQTATPFPGSRTDLVSEHLISQSATEFNQQYTTITISGSTITLPTKTAAVYTSTMGPSFEGNGRESKDPSNLAFGPSPIVLPGTTITQGDMTVTLTQYDYFTTTVIIGSTITLPESTVTVLSNVLPTGPGDLVTITIPNHTITPPVKTITVQGSTFVQAANLLTISGKTVTITGTDYSTSYPKTRSDIVSEGTSTTTISSTITRYVTVTPTSTVTINPDAGVLPSTAEKATIQLASSFQISDIDSTKTAFSTNTTTIASITESTTTSASPLVSSSHSAANLLPTANNATITIDSSSSTDIFSSSTSFLDSSAACSLYSAFSISGCPSPSPPLTAASPISTRGRVTTTFVTLREAITDDITSTIETAFTLTSQSANTTFFRIRGREVFHVRP